MKRFSVQKVSLFQPRAGYRHTFQLRPGHARTVWGRRFSNELPGDLTDIENYFFHTVLQPVKEGLVENLSDYPGYSCFPDAVWGKRRTSKIINWTAC